MVGRATRLTMTAECLRLHEFDNSDAALDDTIWTKRNDENASPQFSATPGLVNAPDDAEDVSFYTGLFLPDEVFDLLVTETHLYAQQYIASTNVRPCAMAAGWKPVTRADMKKMFSLYILSGLVRK
eukprot:scpid99969/ scgid29535/ 